MTTIELTEAAKARRGKMLADVLNLKRLEICEERQASGWIETEWGPKTHVGLYKTVKRIVEEGK